MMIPGFEHFSIAVYPSWQILIYIRHYLNQKPKDVVKKIETHNFSQRSRLPRSIHIVIAYDSNKALRQVKWKWNIQDKIFTVKPLFRSIPAQNDFPLPDKTMERHFESSDKRLKVEPSSLKQWKATEKLLYEPQCIKILHWKYILLFIKAYKLCFRNLC